MRKETKIEVGKKIRSIIDSHKGLFFFEYGKMSVQESLELRRAIRKHSTSGIRSVKNTFVKKAIGDDFPTFPVDCLKGPTGMAYSDKEFIEVAKTLLEFSKTSGKINIKAGYVEGKKMDLPQIEALSKLPGREVLLGQLGGTMASPMRSFLTNLRAPLQNFGLLLNQLKSKKEE